MANTIYRVSYGNEIAYIGSTTENINNTLAAKLFPSYSTAEIDVCKITKIECAETEHVSDMNIYESYYIQKYKPHLNKDSKIASDDVFSNVFPEMNFSQCHSSIINSLAEINSEIELTNELLQTKSVERDQIIQKLKEELLKT